MAIRSNNAADFFVRPDNTVEQNIRPIPADRQLIVVPQKPKVNGLHGNTTSRVQNFRNVLNKSPFAKGAALGAGLSAVSGGDPVDMLQGAFEVGAINKTLNYAGKKLSRTKYGNAIKKGLNVAKNVAGKIPGAAYIGTATKAAPVIGTVASAYQLGNSIYEGAKDINNNKDNSFVGYSRMFTSPIQGFFNYLADDDKKGFQDYLDAVKEEYNDGANEVARANPNINAQLAQEEAKRAAEEQAAAQQAVPQDASWEEQRASLAQAMAQSVKDNPDNPYAWDVAPGFGAVRGSDGQMRYVVPNEPYNPDKAYEQEMRDRAYQYYMDSMSMAGSPFATPERRASELARANSLAQAFGLGLSPDVAAMGGGGGLRAGSNKLDAVAKNTQDLALKGEENKQELLNRLAKASELQNKDTPDIANAQKAMLLANNDIFENVDPLNSNEMANVEAKQLNRLGLDRAIRQSGVTDSSPNTLNQQYSYGAHLYNNAVRPFGLPKMSPNWYAVDKNGDNIKVDLSNANPGELYLAQTYDRINKQATSTNEAYNEYVIAEYKAGRKPLSLAQWIQQRGK